ncbi:hypothetical protein [Stenotrophomonas sp. SPM]|uniref:hypothetical protein n=1 Tax=Stenotrophomonas sp. SPM TaxID=2170735 RepID=UPI0010579100|nr:hypothetical protein [Stenotrophomonas sp. SPM]
MSSKIILALVLSGALAGCSQDSAPPDGGSSAGAAAAGVSEPSVGPESSTAVRRDVARSEATADSTSIAERMCKDQCRDAGPLDARSQEEAEWLIHHRYPSKAELEKLRADTTESLEQKVSLGDSTAAVVLGKRIALEKNFMDGQVMLRNQVLAGNTYALYAISESFRESKVPSVVDGAAYLRLAHFMGDYSAATEIAKMGLSSAELDAADRRATLLYKGFVADQVPDPRPQG